MHGCMPGAKRGGDANDEQRDRGFPVAPNRADALVSQLAVILRSGSPRKRDGGAVLVIVLMILLAMLGLGITSLWMTSGNLAIGANINQRAQAMYSAEAGIERARAILNAEPPLTGAQVNAILAGSNPGPGLDNVPTGVDASGLPNGVGAVLVDGGTQLVNVRFPPASFNRSAGTVDSPLSASMGSYTVWVRNDTAEIRRGQYSTEGNAAVVVRSRGVAPDGRTTVILEVALGATPGSPGTPGGPGAPPPVLCNAGKNSCDDNNSVVSGLVTN